MLMRVCVCVCVCVKLLKWWDKYNLNKPTAVEGDRKVYFSINTQWGIVEGVTLFFGLVHLPLICAF